MTIERIFVADGEAGHQIEMPQVNLVAGAGIEGDRYFASKEEPGQNVTLVEAEEIEGFNAAFGTDYDLSCTRRNLVTRGVRLNDLVGREFHVGAVRLLGVELCTPCATLGGNLAAETVSASEVVKYFARRGGLRADVLSSGSLAVGDSVTIP